MTVQERSGAAEPAPAAAQEDIETGVRVAQLLKDAQRKREAGQITEALADLREANALIKKAKGAGHPDTLPVLDMAGTLLLENGQIAEAQTPLEKAVVMREEMIAAGAKVPPVELAAALVMLARAEMLAGKHEEAGDGLTKAVALFESSVGAGNESTLIALEQLAAVHFALGDAEAGEAALGQVLDRRRKLGAAAKGSMLSTATALARARAWSGRAAAAIGPLSVAINDHERGRLDKKLVPPALRQLADLHAETGDDDSARQAIDRALAIDLAAFGDNHATVIIDRLALVRLEAAAGGAKSVGASCEPLVARLQPLAGSGDQQAAAGLRAAADVWLAAQEFGQASELYRQALELDKRLVGENHPDVVADEVGLGRCLLGNGDAAAALPLLEHATVLSKRIRGPRHADTLAVIAAAGDCAARAGDRAGAEKHLQAVLEAGVPRRSDADEALLSSLVEGVAAVQERAGDRDRAMETRFSIVALRQRQFGEQHDRVADVMVRLANARQAAGAAADAVALYERAIAILEAVHGPDDPEVAAVLAPLAISYRGLGADVQAEQVLARGLTIWEKTVGPDHPVTIAILKPDRSIGGWRPTGSRPGNCS
jgi:tetratricopeptide (TPR) repeat protein